MCANEITRTYDLIGHLIGTMPHGLPADSFTPQQLLFLSNSLYQRAGTGGARVVPTSQWAPLAGISGAPSLIAWVLLH
jgi:hypothetical protein